MKILLAILSMLACSTLAYENTTLSISAAGCFSTGGNYKNTGSIVPVGGQTSRSGSFFHQSGFASGFILQPQTAFDGLPDELNPDNDLDGLDDGEEIAAGSNLWKSDTDSDGLSDFDEVRSHGTNPSQSDSDGDGLDDADELVAGTSPTDSASVLEVALSHGASANQLSWFGVSGRYYQLEYTDDLSAGWQPYGNISVGTGSSIIMLDVAAGSNRFCRIRVSDDPGNF